MVFLNICLFYKYLFTCAFCLDNSGTLVDKFWMFSFLNQQLKCNILNIGFFLNWFVDLLVNCIT